MSHEARLKLEVYGSTLKRVSLRYFVVFFSLSGECRDSVLKHAMAASLRILTCSQFIVIIPSIQSYITTAVERTSLSDSV